MANMVLTCRVGKKDYSNQDVLREDDESVPISTGLAGQHPVGEFPTAGICLTSSKA
jgi:hypothetical protein